MTQLRLLPTLPDACRVKLVCGHVLELPSRRRLELRLDGWYAALYCALCERRREVRIVIWGVAC